jgi:hypothetical protein
MDGCVVHEEYHWSVVILPVASDFQEKFVDEVFEHRGIDSTLNQLNGHDLLLTDSC